ncbi:MFS transporter [Saccharopolyspora erythraea]|uniref:Probable multidrug ABC transporter, permease n=1 Tax=Saccharopolyspora erythraea (strain ATCC 11635 / DSM 40517 / JCM 4748 / NBRC 13426 / NCIMB 8594 / NRRL 2338) TaxID=405948 RepID=A4FI02_SACEN|nr:MFS transporter [Saccharopolyspora erythraea]QRK93720.1 MFS transporter [Saccharopolyspora erythraea]CAM03677.1 probable multidrug ABC transporter, permease [Saccharopolyspora erythraea NRRL 2338]
MLVGAQVLSGAGLAAGITVGALLAEDMLGSTGLAGLPSGLFTIGSAVAATVIGRTSQHLGRRTGLAAGYVVGAVGGLGVVIAAATGSVFLLFLSLFVYGSGTATNLQARYAGADLAVPHHRGRAVSTVLVATTAGAVAGPNLVTVMGSVADAVGIPSLAGPFILAAFAYAAAGVVLWIMLRPDPLLTARSHAAENARAANGDADEPVDPTGRSGLLLLGTAVMVLTQLIMVAVMTMTPIHMQHHGQGVGAAGLVIAVHVGAMYLPSPFSGLLVDRFGRLAVAAASGLTLLASGLLAALAPPHSVWLLALALALLGLGWNFGLVSGTAIITDTVPLATRAKTQGTVDVAVALAGAGGGTASGLVVAASGFSALAIAGGILGLAIIPAVAWTARVRPSTTGS